MQFSMDDIPWMNSSHFSLESCSERTGDYFMVTINNGQLDTGFFNPWKPVGKTKDPLFKGHYAANIAVMFEDEDGTKTWFHLYDPSQETDRQTAIAALQDNVR
ncbi:MAG: hypothetical protein ABFD97_14420 [Syntrophobacter sp.]